MQKDHHFCMMAYHHINNQQMPPDRLESWYLVWNKKTTAIDQIQIVLLNLQIIVYWYFWFQDSTFESFFFSPARRNSGSNASATASSKIVENLEEAQHFIDNIVGIKGITEDPHGAAVKLGISYAEPNDDAVRDSDLFYIEQQQQLPRVSISSSIVPSNEELYGY